ncbi:tetratricopeptide repeat protein [Shewanella dokdonensis]|uniref:tetratricopeptide repeat protein n=1 Tax=Shewanella dokdonensis TaxID=712036 RepID=UPI00200C2AB3|nr:tetratricopeptide repeat protein [Shewanella dokdonensis]MCL1073541.1 tetratricopeptide repeat protein [Shewanella dokdonensis]
MMCWIPQASAQTADETEIALRETPQALYESIIKDYPTDLQFSSRAQLQQQAKALRLDPQTLLNNMMLLVRLNLDVQVKKNNKQTEARQLLDQLQLVVQSDAEKAMLLNLEGRYQGRIKQDYNQTITLNNQALSLLQNKDDPASLVLKFVVYEDLGVVSLMLKKQQAALNNLLQLKKVAEQLHSRYLIAEAETKLGKYFRSQDKLEQALKHYIAAYQLSSQENSLYQKAVLQLNLAKLYRDLEQWDDALNYSHQAIDSFKKLNFDAYLSSCMTVIATVYAHQEEWNKAIDYYLNAQQIDAKLQNIIAQGLNFHNLGEAYFKLGNPENALDYLHQANKIFRERHSNHYLVYNELLIAQVANASHTWELVLDHAQKAEALAQQLHLDAELAEALGYQVNAYKAKGDNQTVVALQDKLLTLKQSQIAQQQDQQQQRQSGELNEQQLTLKVTQLQQQNQRQQEILNTRDYFIGAILLLLVVAGSYCLYLLREQYRHKRQLAVIRQCNTTDPITALPGFRGFCEQIYENCTAIALLAVKTEFAADLVRGHHQASKRQQTLLHKLRHLSKAQVYSLRPGLYGLVFEEALNAKQLQHRLDGLTLDEQPLMTDFGFIPHPLLADTDVQLPTAILYETLQLALSASLSLPSAESHYVALSALDFTPSGIFSNPLYEQLEKGIDRGFIRIETNGNKSEIHWPPTVMSAISDNHDII